VKARDRHWFLRLALVASGLTLVGAAIVIAGGIPKTVWGFPGSSALWSLGFVGAGFLADRARPDIPVGIFMMLGGVVAAVQEVLVQLSVRAEDGVSPGIAVIAQAVTWTWMVALAFVITALLRFPDGNRPGPGWRRVEVLLWSATVFTAIVSVFGPAEGFSNPLEIVAWSDGFLVAITAGYILWNLVAVVALLSIVIRLRRSEGVERQQLKWVAFAVSAMGVLALTIEVFLANFSEDVYLRVTWLVALSILLIPIAMAMAMLRYRLYDVDRVVSRSVAYSLVAAVLGLVYAGVVVALQTVSPASGNLAVAASTLAVAVLFNPVRLRVQRWVDRRFNRASYDAAKEVDAFTSRLRSAVDPAAITLDLGAVLASTIQPSSARVWIRGEPRV
jgi:hypothetical protein